MRILTGLLAALLVTSTAAAVDLTVVTPKGYVTFFAGDDWTVIGSQTKMPVAVMAFQIPDRADEGTPDSTNLAVNLYDQNTPEGREAMNIIGERYGAVGPKVSRLGDWEVFDQRAMQNTTTYTILDARRNVADVTVSVRLAWPHLSGHTKNHERDMRELFAKVLASVYGGLGPYKPKEGATVLRPNQ